MTKEAVQQPPTEGQQEQFVKREQWQANMAVRQGIGDGPNANLREPLRPRGPIAYLKQVRQGEGLSGQHRRLEAFWPHFKAEFAKDVRRGIQEGYIPHYVDERIGPALEKTGVRVVDSYILDPEDRGHSATYTPGIDEVRMRPAKDIARHVLDVAHEFYHKLSGGTFQVDPKNPKEIYRRRGGYNSFQQKEAAERHGHRNVDEVAIHQLALGTMTGDFETLDPDKRADGNMDQYTRRKIVATFVDMAGGAIKVRSLTNAVFEDSGPEGSSELRRRFVRETVNAYGWGALRKLETLCDSAEKMTPDMLQSEILDRIQPPLFDTEGTIVRQGKIEVEGMHLPMPLSEGTETMQTENYHTHFEKPPGLGGEPRPRFELATPFGPNANETGQDTQFAPEALHTLRDGWEEMHAQSPDFYVGMAVHGSVVKGRSHEHSDVDGIVFFDPDAPSVQSLSYVDMLRKPTADIRNTILKRLREKSLAETFTSLGSYNKVAMNEGIIDKALAGGELGGPLVPGRIGQDIMQLFCMRIGSGKLLEYRARVLDKLSQLENGEQIWQALMSDLASYEEARRDAKIYLPPTIKDGYDYFRVRPTEVSSGTLASTPDSVTKSILVL
jgi:hypothetical protein